MFSALGGLAAVSGFETLCVRSKCGPTTSTLGKKVQAVEHWPKVLIVHWKRFGWEKEGAVKVEGTVPLPLRLGGLFFGGSRQP